MYSENTRRLEQLGTSQWVRSSQQYHWQTTQTKRMYHVLERIPERHWLRARKQAPVFAEGTHMAGVMIIVPVERQDPPKSNPSHSYVADEWAYRSVMALILTIGDT